MILIMSTGQWERDVVYISSGQGIYFFPGMQAYYWNGIWDMILYDRLLKEKKRLGKFILRFPKTNQELLDRKRWDRIIAILMRRYEYGIEDPIMEQYRYGDFRDEIITVNLRR